jgi:hypothetical protein
MILSFEITMPNVGSWNGQWTGVKNLHFAFRSYSKKEAERLMQNKEYRNFYYNFGDGWGANVKMKPILAKDKKSIEKMNSGFMGYEWMIDSIEKEDRIKC